MYECVCAWACSEDTLNFWKGIADVGLMGEVVTNIRTELLEMLKGVQLRSDQTSLQDSGEHRQGWRREASVTLFISGGTTVTPQSSMQYIPIYSSTMLHLIHSLWRVEAHG